MGRGPQRETSKSCLTADTGDVVAQAYDIYTSPHTIKGGAWCNAYTQSKGALGATLTLPMILPPMILPSQTNQKKAPDFSGAFWVDC